MATQSTQRLSELAQRLRPFTKAAPAPAEAGNGLAGLGVKEDEYLAEVPSAVVQRRETDHDSQDGR